ncbi:hypothetical protein SNE40_003482 [Patella caerulea]|uniref:Uncharacterized protein n=1 Tax=Patella caerulea TaxID=87958 RepID=A0AAN8K9X2_PATCE
MATNTKDKILDYLKTCPNNSAELHRIIKHVNLPKKTVNHQIYELQKQSLVDKLQQSPPIWRLTSRGEITKNSNVAERGRGGARGVRRGSKRGQGRGRGQGHGFGRGHGPDVFHGEVWGGIQGNQGTLETGHKWVTGRGNNSRQTASEHSVHIGNRVPIPIQPSQSSGRDTSEQIIKVISDSTKPLTASNICDSIGSYITIDMVNKTLGELIEKNLITKIPSHSRENDTYSLKLSIQRQQTDIEEEMQTDNAQAPFQGSVKQISIKEELPLLNCSPSNEKPVSLDCPPLKDEPVSMQIDNTQAPFQESVKQISIKEEPPSLDCPPLNVKPFLPLQGEALSMVCPPSSAGIISNIQNNPMNTNEPCVKVEPGITENYVNLDLEEDGASCDNISATTLSYVDPETEFMNKVLVTLANRCFETAASFVLAKDLNADQKDVENSLKELAFEKLVSKTGTAWSVTKKGDTFLAENGLKVKNDASPIQNLGRGQRLKQAFSGPPQSPLALVRSSSVFGSGCEKPPPLSEVESFQLPRSPSIQLSSSVTQSSSTPFQNRINTSSTSVNQNQSQTSSLLSGVQNNINKIHGIGRGYQIEQMQNLLAQMSPIDSGNRVVKIPPTPMQVISQEQTQLQSKNQPQNVEQGISPSPLFNSTQTSSQTLNSVNLPPSLLPYSLDKEQPSNISSSSQSSTLMPSSSSTSNSSNNLQISTESFSAVNKNPISALMEYAQSRHLTAKIEILSQRGPSHKPTFTIAAIIGSRMFPKVKSHNKKEGRTEAADVALRTLLSEGEYKVNQEPSPAPVVANFDMTHFDNMAALSHQSFNKLIASIPEKFAGRKIIAALIMKTGKDDVGTVISVGSGNRCITGEQLSLEGNTVNDSHAEIITRRGFLRYLYKQLETYNKGTEHEFFESSNNGKLKVKSNITFHLYISTAPCGDGALFSPRDAASNRGPVSNVECHEHQPTFTSNVQGLLRTKMEGGEGTIPVEADFTVQTWDGIVRGERLRTMSCTDKICRWNIVGMQGALLSHLLDPVYLNSLTLGYLYDHGHLARAVCCRVGKGTDDINQQLPDGYHLNHPWLGRMTACEPQRETQKTKALSINWCLGDEKPEVIDGVQGRCYTGVESHFFSRVCKKDLFTSFQSVCHKFGRTDLLAAKSYNDAKKMSKDFQNAKSIMLKRLKDNGFGIWVSKPVEEEMFGL